MWAIVTALILFGISVIILICFYNSPSKIKDVVITKVLSATDLIVYQFVLNKEDLMLGNDHSYYDNIGFHFSYQD